MIEVCCSGKCWLARPDVLRQPFLISALNALAGRVWTVSTEDWKKFKKHAQMFTEQCCHYVTFVRLALLPRREFMLQWKKELWVHALACASFSGMQQIRAPTWIPAAEQSQRRGISWTSHARRLTDRQDMFRFWPRPTSFPPFFFFFLFCPSFLSSLCLSAPSSLSLSRFILLLPVIRALWSGPRETD